MFTAVVITQPMLRLRDVENQSFKFSKTFAEGNFLASGFLVIPKGKSKPNKNSKDAVMVCVLIPLSPVSGLYD